MISKQVRKNYNGNWLELFDVYIIQDKEYPKLYGKVCLSTPDFEYTMDKSQFNEFKRKVNSI